MLLVFKTPVSNLYLSMDVKYNYTPVIRVNWFSGSISVKQLPWNGVNYIDIIQVTTLPEFLSKTVSHS